MPNFVFQQVPLVGGIMSDVERPKPYAYGAYLAHASEDKPFVRALAAELNRHGWSTWLDEAELVVGLSLREQLDAGLSASRFGVVILSHAFFAKSWPRAELDAVFAMDSNGLPRLLPVWLNVTESDVQLYSPIVASRFAVVSAGDATRAAAELARSMERLAGARPSWADRVRGDTTEGLLWLRAPQFLAKSLTYIDEHFVEYWRGRAAPSDDVGPVDPVLLSEVFDHFPRFEARPIAVFGYQIAQQLLHSEVFDGLELHEYVVQVKTGQPGYQTHLLYVRLAEAGPSPFSADVPVPPPDHLVFLQGVAIARGAMRVSTGETFSAVYMIAARLAYLPRKHNAGEPGSPSPANQT